ncbi:glycosyltransferase [Ectobacillus antri]|uniref:glycosyltransferase n=1 Tax=Ectobacillus antri TaxID=2486280 RepID=UPI000F59D274|nr:glycosyltransferase [Ectobacillus antri]
MMKRILFVLNDIGGGTAQYQRLYIESEAVDAYYFEFRGRNFVVTNSSGQVQIVPAKETNFAEMMQNLSIEEIYVNHFIRFPLGLTMKCIQESGIPYVYVAHDFFCVCPRVYLLNRNGVYCHAEKNESVCQSCLHGMGRISIVYWRRLFEDFLAGAVRIVAPSESTKQIIQSYFPSLRIEVKPHQVPYVKYTYKEEFATAVNLKIGFIGNIQRHKGSDIVYALQRAIFAENLPISLCIIGSTDKKNRDIEATGPYKKEDVSSLLQQYSCALVITSSICPETFSYTTHEALGSGYPVITFNLGAPAERISGHGGGWVVNDVNSNSLLQLLKYLLTNRQEIIDVAAVIKR